jgi:hypothetical protein
MRALLAGLAGRRAGVFADRGLRRLLARHLEIDRLEQAAVPLHVVAYDVAGGEEVRLSRGPAAGAVLASAAVPGLLPPPPRAPAWTTRRPPMYEIAQSLPSLESFYAADARRRYSRERDVALVPGRVVGFVRAFTPFLAGASAMPARRLAGFGVAGAGAWCAALIGAGYVFAASLESHLDAAGNVALAIAGGLLLLWALRRVASTADGERRQGSGGSHRARRERVGERRRRRRSALARAGRAAASGEPVGARARLVLGTADGVSG